MNIPGKAARPRPGMTASSPSSFQRKLESTEHGEDFYQEIVMHSVPDLGRRDICASEKGRVALILIFSDIRRTRI